MIHRAGLEYIESTATATRIAPQAQPAAPSMRDTVSTTTAAEMLGLTDSAIRKAITEKRLRQRNSTADTASPETT